MADIQQAIAAIKAGDKITGKQLLIEIIKADPRNENAWLWMTNVTGSDTERATCLENVLKINPNNEDAKKALATIQQRQASQPIGQPKVEVLPKPVEAPPKPEPITQAQKVDRPQDKEQAPPLSPRPLKALKQKVTKKNDPKGASPRPVSQLETIKTSITDIFRVNKIKAELNRAQKESETLKSTLADTERMNFYELKQAIADLSEKKSEAIQEIKELELDFARRKKALDQQIVELNQQIEVKKDEIVILDDEILLQSFGFYKFRYELQNSEMYKTKLEQVQNQQAVMVKAGEAAYCSQTWTVNNSQREGERMIKDYVKLILRSFNNECDASIIKVKFNNIDSIEKKINKAFETLNNLGRRMHISISSEYLNLKLQELYLFYEYQVKKQQEKEEQKLLREQMREEAKLLKEIEEMKLKLGKEETHFAKALVSIDAQLLKATSDAEREMLAEEKANLQLKLAEIEQNRQDLLNREQNTRAGYVYVISNVGSFGENVYKIGVTRRLDPQERIDELGDASVPFKFDIHATIFSEDAPALEYALHQAFEHRRLNIINRRREFFNVTLKEIEEVVKTNFNKPVEFIELADAVEYRESLALKGERVF
ncbi:MAG: hypothetical protein BroJett011_20380 [Chloroflexota bacterium]|nr:MAG: hypothetical protein BroJett011_20380 [Chloroflexota bacterium]